MFIEEIHAFVRFLVRKGQGQHYSPVEIDRAINFASMELFRGYLPTTEKAEINTAILSKFYKTETISLTDGKTSKPADFAYYIDAALTDGTWVEEIKEGDWNSRIKDPVEPPEKEYPICTIRGNDIILEPQGVSPVRITYIRYPLKVKFAYNVVNLEFVFKPEGSIDIEWPEVVHNEIIQKTITNLGFNLKNDQTAIQYESYKKQING